MPTTIEEYQALLKERDRKRAEVEELERTLAHLKEEIAKGKEEI